MALLKRCSALSGTEPSKYNELNLSHLKELVIGRDYDCDIRISNIEISRRHAKVIRNGDMWTITDLKSTNGLYINGSSLPPMVPHPLKDNDMISFGPLEKSEFLYKFKRDNVQTLPSISNEPQRRAQPLATCSNGKPSTLVTRKKDEKRLKQTIFTAGGSNSNEHNQEATSSKSATEDPNHDHRYAAVKRESIDLVSEADMTPSPRIPLKKKSKRCSTQESAPERVRLTTLEQQMKEKSRIEEKLKKKLQKQESKLKLQELVSLKREEKIQQLLQELQKQRKKTEEAEKKRKEEEEKRIKQEEEKKKLKEREELQKKELMELRKKQQLALKMSKEAKTKSNEDAQKHKTIIKTETGACAHHHEAINEGASCSGDHLKRKYEDIFDSELTCSICHELFIQPITLSCSHTFCTFCVEQWKRKRASNRECPICRKPMTNMTRQLVIESLVDKIVNEMDEEAKSHRKKIVEERKIAALSKPSTSKNDGSFDEDSSDADDFWDTDSDSDSESYGHSILPVLAWNIHHDGPWEDDDFEEDYELHEDSELDDSDNLDDEEDIEASGRGDDLENMDNSWNNDESSVESFESANDHNDDEADIFSDGGDNTVNFGDIFMDVESEGDSSDPDYPDITDPDVIVENEL